MVTVLLNLIHLLLLNCQCTPDRAVDWDGSLVNDANILRKFRAPYRNAIGFPDANLMSEYRAPWTMKDVKPIVETTRTT